MTLKQWEANGWLKPHKSSRKEIANLLAIVRRDVADARAKGISDDWRFGFGAHSDGSATIGGQLFAKELLMISRLHGQTA